MISGLIGILVFIGAASLGALEKALSPEQRRFPCVNKATIWILRGYTVALVGAAFDRMWNAYIGTPPPWSAWQLGAAAFMALAHSALLYFVLRSRLPADVWPYLQLRYERTRRAARFGGLAGVVLAQRTADPDSDMPVELFEPPISFDRVLRDLLHLR